MSDSSESPSGIPRGLEGPARLAAESRRYNNVLPYENSDIQWATN